MLIRNAHAQLSLHAVTTYSTVHASPNRMQLSGQAHRTKTPYSTYFVHTYISCVALLILLHYRCTSSRTILDSNSCADTVCTYVRYCVVHEKRTFRSVVCRLKVVVRIRTSPLRASLKGKSQSQPQSIFHHSSISNIGTHTVPNYIGICTYVYVHTVYAL